MKKLISFYSLSIFLLIIIAELLTRNLIMLDPLLIVTKNEGQFYYPQKLIVRGIEGSISAKIDKNGFNNKCNFESSNKTVCVIGDSYTEALHVDQNKNYSAVLNNKFKGYSFYNLGISGQSIAHYISYANWYEEKFKCVISIVLLASSDVTSDAVNNEFMRIVWEGEKFVIKTKDNKSKLKTKVSEFFGGTPPAILSCLAMKLKEFNLILKTPSINLEKASIGPEKPEKNEENNKSDYADQIIWSMKNLKDSYNSPILVLYIPDGIPTVQDGKVNFNEGQESLKIKKIIHTQCQENGMGFIDTTESLSDFFKTTGRFPRGFSNTTPGSGHFNEFGHKVVADTIAKYLIENNYLEDAK